MCTNDIFLGVLAVLFPPLPVWVKSGLCSADALINILLCLLGYLPGLLHAWYIIAKHPDPPYDYDHPYQHAYGNEHAPAPAPHDPRVAYEYVYVRSPPPQGGMNYSPAAAANAHQGFQQQPSYSHHGYHGQRQQSSPHHGYHQGQHQHEYAQHHHVQDGMNYGTAGAWAQQQHQREQDGQGCGEGGSGAPPPPYTPLPGDHKIQTRD